VAVNNFAAISYTNNTDTNLEFAVNLDDVLFIDTFESGDTTAWSSVVGD
jgi:hypothetical protein